MEFGRLSSADVAKRKDRAIATVLAFKENECDQYLPPEVSARFRKLILDQINDLFVACSQDTSPTVVLNEHYLDKINEMYEVVVNGR